MLCWCGSIKSELHDHHILSDELRHDENYSNDELDYDEDEQGAHVFADFSCTPCSNENCED